MTTPKFYQFLSLIALLLSPTVAFAIEDDSRAPIVLNEAGMPRVVVEGQRLLREGPGF